MSDMRRLKLEGEVEVPDEVADALLEGDGEFLIGQAITLPDNYRYDLNAPFYWTEIEEPI